MAFALWCAVFLLYFAFLVPLMGREALSPGAVASALAGTAGWALLIGTAANRLQGYSRKLAAGIVYLPVGIFMWVAFGFARLYERPFSWAFIRLDTTSIWKENFVSAFHEISFIHLVYLACLVVLFVALMRIAEQRRRRADLARLGAGALAVLFSLLLQDVPPGLVAHPITAAWAAKPKPRVTNLTVAADDVIPELAAPAGALLPAIGVPRAQKKNVILYFLESTPASVIGKSISGKELTPHLNRLRERSLYFSRHYANFPLSINAFYNAFCSAYALPDGAWISLALPDFPVPCLSEILKKHGYRTAALHAGYLGYAKQKRFMQKRGFDLLRDAETLKVPPYEKGMGPWGAADERALIQPLADFAAAGEQPFLAILFAFAPHHPYSTPEDYPGFITPEADVKKQQRRFYNSLHFADAAFGTILAALENKGVLKDTILIVVGDHGEAFYEHPGNYNHPFFLYEENVHVPLFVWFDGVKPAVVDRVTSHVDILPSVLDLLGKSADVAPLHVGRSVFAAGPERLAHLQAFWQEELSGVVDRRYKFIRRETGAMQLFDLAADAAEKENRAPALPELAAAYNRLTETAFLQKKAYYKKYANYELVRFRPASQDK